MIKETVRRLVASTQSQEDLALVLTCAENEFLLWMASWSLKYVRAPHTFKLTCVQLRDVCPQLSPDLYDPTEDVSEGITQARLSLAPKYFPPSPVTT
jgi:hypothetical protein